MENHIMGLLSNVIYSESSCALRVLTLRVMPVGELLAVLGARVAFAENHWSVVWTSSENQEKRIQGP